jgi:hypothetical protein
VWADWQVLSHPCSIHPHKRTTPTPRNLRDIDE